MRDRTRTPSLASVVLVIASGCATSSPYIYNSLDAEIEVEQSQANEFTYLRAYEHRGELVIYGDVEPRGEPCCAPPIVELSIERSEGDTVQRVCIPVVDRGSYRRGWYGASFRARLQGYGREPCRIRFSIRDEACRSTEPTVMCIRRDGTCRCDPL